MLDRPLIGGNRLIVPAQGPEHRRHVAILRPQVEAVEDHLGGLGEGGLSLLDRPAIHRQCVLLMALPVEHDAKVVERPSQVVPGLGIIGELADQALAEGQRLAVRLEDLRDLAGILLAGGLGVVRLGQVAAVPGVRRVELDQFFIDSDRFGDRVQAKLAVGEPGLDVTIVGLLPGQRLVDLAAPPRTTYGCRPHPRGPAGSCRRGAGRPPGRRGGPGRRRAV